MSSCPGASVTDGHPVYVDVEMCTATLLTVIGAAVPLVTRTVPPSKAHDEGVASFEGDVLPEPRHREIRRHRVERIRLADKTLTWQLTFQT